MEYCTECGEYLTNAVTEYSVKNYGLPLCIEHQQWTEKIGNYTTQETIRLYYALKQRGVPASIEHFDGHKHVDIAIPDAKVNIEVDGKHHNYNSMQALADLKRTYFSFLAGVYTIRIPNSLVYNDYVLNETAEFLVLFLNENLRKFYKRR